MRAYRIGRALTTAAVAAAAALIMVGLAGPAAAAPSGGPSGDAFGGATAGRTVADRTRAAAEGGPRSVANPLRLRIVSASDVVLTTKVRWSVDGTFPFPADAPFSCVLGGPSTNGFRVQLVSRSGSLPVLLPVVSGPDSCVRVADGVELHVTRVVERDRLKRANQTGAEASVMYWNAGTATPVSTNAVVVDYTSPGPPTVATADTAGAPGLDPNPR